jgi:hypothetical protein
MSSGRGFLFLLYRNTKYSITPVTPARSAMQMAIMKKKMLSTDPDKCCQPFTMGRLSTEIPNPKRQTANVLDIGALNLMKS